MTEELQKKAEDFIIDRYKIAECYREDNAETREYMRMDVHSQYEKEYQLYLDATKELEKENAELKCECRRCVYTDSPCILSDYGKDKNGICDHFKDVFEENAELKADNDARKFAMAMSEKVEKQLREENAELNETLGKCAKMPVLYCLGAKETIAKAKELLKGWLGDFYNPKAFYQQRAELVEQSEQFLKECEK